MDSYEVVVVGGVNLDIKGQSKALFQYGTSNPGIIKTAAGGVGRNIAENLARLDVAVTLLGVIGQDPEGDQIIRETVAAGVDTGHLLRLEDAKTGVYIALDSDNGEMVAALSDMEIFNRFPVAYLESQSDLLRQARFIVCDTNIPENALVFLLELAAASGVPVCVEPVSIVKSQRIVRHLRGVDILTPNLDELAAIAGQDAGPDNVAEVAAALTARGVGTVVTTMGEKGICCTTKEGSRFFPSYPTQVVEVTGAGDALTAGLIYGLTRGYPLPDACRCGLAAAALTVASPDTVSRSIRRNDIRRLMIG